MKTYVLVQHPQSEDQVTDMVSSWTEWVLTDIGRFHAAAIANTLFEEYAREKVALYSSDLARAHMTAQLIGDLWHTKPVLRTGLRDMHMGSATGKPCEWLDSHLLPVGSEPYWFDYRPIPDAESWRELTRRVRIVFEEVAALPTSTVILVSHYLPLRIFLHLWLFDSVEHYPSLCFGNVPGGVSVLTLDEENRKTICKLNDTGYFKKDAVNV